MFSGKNKIITFFFLATIIVAARGEQSTKDPLARPVLYAPQRDSYRSGIKETKPKKKTAKAVCVFCADIANHIDPKNFIVARFKYNAVFLNLYPTGKGQILIIPNAHVENLENLTSEARAELMALITAAPRILKEVLNAQGINVGINLGKIAGASKPDHLHIHVLPRYKKEGQAFLELLGETRTIQWDLKRLYKQLRPAFEELKAKLAQQDDQAAEKTNTCKTLKDAAAMQG